MMGSLREIKKCLYILEKEYSFFVKQSDYMAFKGSKNQSS